MKRERLTGLAVRAYPDDALAAEIKSTALDVGAESRTRFVRELAGLARAGLRERATRIATVGPARLVLDGFCLAAVWSMTLDFAVTLSQRYGREMHDPLLVWPLTAMLAVAVCLAFAGLDRPAGVVLLAWSAARLPALAANDAALASLPSVALYAVLVVRPRRRERDLRGLVYLAVPLALFATFGPPTYEQSSLMIGIVVCSAAAVIVGAIIALPTDPRVALAGAVFVSWAGIDAIAKGGAPIAAVLTLGAPFVIAFTVVRARRLVGAQRSPELTSSSARR
ncbi:MAG TPA: hypothetical protein VI300_18570 [Solirubrobacter sp.]